jgi:hypothetical protein
VRSGQGGEEGKRAAAWSGPRGPAVASLPLRGRELPELGEGLGLEGRGLRSGWWLGRAQGFAYIAAGGELGDGD